MASSKVMASSKPKNSDLASTSSSSTAPRSRRFSSSSSTTTKHRSSDRSTTIRPLNVGNSSSSNMTVDGILHNVYSAPSSEPALLDAQITLMDAPAPPPPPPPALAPPSLAAAVIQSSYHANGSNDQEMAIAVAPTLPGSNKTVDDMWKEIVSGRKELKEEPDEMMTLEDFLAKAGAVEVGGDDDEDEVKMPELASERLSGGVFAFDPVTVPPPNAIHMLDKVEGSIVGFGNGVEVAPSGGGLGVGRGKRGRAPVLEQLDKAAQQRQKRMIKNRESAARSRERKQAYQVELESLAVKLEEENEQLLMEKEERTKERLKQLMEKVFPVVVRRKPPRTLRRVRSWVW
ncbi:unnamed protein product [Linum tenue]|uniref:BZIP domain-containing protein n=1 Tax=Linum tenue TaxID=586396 RepID=A0AAV0IFM9_9ROSI|nr:unnamed protein product [Linum tenue]